MAHQPAADEDGGPPPSSTAAHLSSEARLLVEVASPSFLASRLADVDLSDRGLTALPPAVCTALAHVGKLNLAGNRLSDLPAEFGALTRLHTAFFLGNRFAVAPAVLGTLPSLRMLSFKSCGLATLPGAALAPTLEWLILTDNALTSLPAEVGRLARLRKLMLASNRLTALPDMSRCAALELVRLSDNALTAVPPSLLRLPRLAWLALAGNAMPPRHRDSPLVVPPALGGGVWGGRSLGRVLGDGASGTVYEVEGGAGAAGGVAAKVFKPASSDGRVVDEVAASLALAAAAAAATASSAAAVDSDADGEATSLRLGWPHLVHITGFIPGAAADGGAGAGAAHAGGSGAGASATAAQPSPPPTPAPTLLMELLPPDYTTLGRTPSFASVTRDVYAPGAAFGLAQAVCVARGVTAAVAAMHAAGLVHGDVYAHNTLTAPPLPPPPPSPHATASGIGDGPGGWRVKLCDLGAAYFLPDPASVGGDVTSAAGDAETVDDPAALLRRLESRALGCLFEELCVHVAPLAAGGDAAAAAAHGAAIGALARLRDACLREDVAARPEARQLLREFTADPALAVWV